MIRVFLLSIFLFNTCLIVISSPIDDDYDQEDAIKHINETSDEFFNLYDILAQKAFDNDDENFFEALLNINLLEEAAMNLAEMSRYIKKFPYESYNDEEIKLGMRNLRTAAYLYVLEENYFNKFLVTTNYLRKLGNEKVVCNFNDKTNCKLAFYPDIYKIVSKSQNNEELKYYWTAWRDSHKQDAMLHLTNFIDWFEEAAKSTDVTPLALWYSDYKDEKFLEQMEKVMKEIEPFYKAMHAYVRYSLNKLKGDDIVPPKGPISYHLVEQVLAQNWKNENNIEIPYPDDKLVQLDEKINEKNFDARKFVEIADDFYKSLGFEELPNEFWGESFKELPNALDNCRAEIFDKTPSPYIKYCPQTDFRKFLQIHGWMGRIHYAYQKKDLAFAHFQSYKFAVPVGEAVILSSSTPKYLDELDIIANSEYTEKQFVNRLFKMGVHTIFNIPMFFVHSKVINDLLSDEIQISEVNKHYWKLMENYAGISPPVDRPEGSIDFPDKFYEDLENNFHTNKFVAEIAGYQMYRGLCEKSGLYTVNDPKTPLHNCDFYKNLEAGKALKEMMKVGSKKTWQEVLGIITNDNNGLNGDAMLKYYEPLLTWLKESNEEKNIFIGWEESSRIVA